MNFTGNAKLQKPGTAERGWDVPLNANADLLDSMTAVGALVVTPTEIPSATLNVRVSPGNYRKGDGTVGSFPGVTTYAVAASSTVAFWLTDSGTLTAGSSFPSTSHVRLAVVTTAATTIAAISDQRIQCASCGSGLGFILRAGDSVPDGASFSLGTSAGTQIGTAANQKLAFFGASPATQALTTAALTDSTGGAVASGVVDSGMVFNQATLNANFATLANKVNTLIAAFKRHGLMGS